MPFDRRAFLARAAAVVAADTLVSSHADAKEPAPLPIVDCHQHLWDLERFRLPWLEGAPKVLRQNYRPEEYRTASRDTGITRAVYMEVDVDPKQHLAEADYVAGLCRGKGPTVAAVVGGRPASAGFGAYVKELLKRRPHIKGVRQVLHNDADKPGQCLQDDFVRGVRLLGDSNLSFDLCMRPRELADGVRLSERCPDTRFILDHCGNADPKVFRRKRDDKEKPAHDPDAWRRDIERCAKRPNMICKISGIVARAPKGWSADDLAPIVNHCLDAFGPDRVIFGGDWPVCLLGATLRQWVEALRTIVARRPAADQRKLWSQNAVKFYGLGG